MSRTTRATAHSRVPVRIHTLAGDTDYTIYRVIEDSLVRSFILLLS